MTKITGEEVINKLKGKGVNAVDVAVSAAMAQLADQGTSKTALSVGFLQGMIRQDIKIGIKAGLATYGVMAGANAIMNVAKKWDEL